MLERGRHEIEGIPQRGSYGQHYTQHTAIYDPGQTSSTGVDPISPIGHDSYGDSTLPGSAQPGSHSAAFGLNSDGRRYEPQPPTDSSVSNLSTGSGHHTPQRSGISRQDSGNAPQTVSGNVERVPTVRHTEPGTNNTTAMGETQSTGAVPDSNVKKSGTFSKLFKRKPVGGTDPVVEGGDRKKYY